MREFEGTLRLQGIGIVEGIKAINLKVGDFQVWNYGSSSEIVKIETTKTGKTLIITYKWFNEHVRVEEGKWVGEWQEQIRKLRVDTIIAVKELNSVQEEITEVEHSIVEELKQESETVINSINTEYLETKKASLEIVSTQLDKIYNAIEENRNNEEIRPQLRDIENDLKWHYSSLCEMVEGQNNDIDSTIEEPKQESIINKLENLINDSFDLNKTTDSEEQRASIRLYFKRLLATSKYTQCILSVYKDSDIRMDFNNGFSIPLNFKLHEDRERVLKSIRNAINQFQIVKIKLV